MEALINIKSYAEFEQAFDIEIVRQSEGFVRMGYLLKIARDTDILYESGYKSIAEFAEKRYGLTADTVSKFIGINDRFSVDGYSDRLDPKYSVYGMTLLAEMLTLSDAVIEALPESVTRQELREVKREIKEEQKTTDIEVMLEGEETGQQERETALEKVLFQYYRENSREYAAAYKASHQEGDTTEKILLLLAPSGVGVKMIRLQGIGKIMLSIKGKDQDLELLNVRTNETETYSWEQCAETFRLLCEGPSYKKSWEKLYGEPYPEDAIVTEKKPVPEIEPEPERETKPISVPESLKEVKAEQEPVPDLNQVLEPDSVEPEAKETQVKTGELQEPRSPVEVVEETKEITPEEDSSLHRNDENEKFAPAQLCGDMAAGEMETLSEIIGTMKLEAEGYLENIKRALEENRYSTARTEARNLMETLTGIVDELEKKPLPGQEHMELEDL